MPCPSPIYTDDEFRPIVEGLFYGSWLNVAVGFILFVNVYVLKPSKRNIFGWSLFFSRYNYESLELTRLFSLVVIQISALFVYNLMILMKSNFNVRDAALDVQICDSNASWFSYHTRYRRCNSAAS